MQKQGKSYINASSSMPIRQTQTHLCNLASKSVSDIVRVGNRDLAPFFQTNQNGQKQADGQDEARGIPFWEERQGTFVQQKTQDAEQDEMSHFIPAWKIIDGL